jgi:hypothetical protein
MSLRGGTTKQSHGRIAALYSMRLPRNDMILTSLRVSRRGS